ncbi:MAG: PstS family phosphate ABC transporter substrate-binding protein [Chloroflexi bacterium]|nr:PstS family phosphate ABC transporter substrate-binding protein [Chloroflexota bacterium]
MTSSTARRLRALAIGAAVLIAACGAGSSAPSTDALGGTVTIDGSSTVYPITEIAAEDFIAANPGVQVPVSLSGTGGGFQKFCRGETDINDASRPIKEDDDAEGVACAANGIEFVKLQVAIDGLSVVVNPANDWATCLMVEELSTIYGPDSPEDLQWSDVRAGFPDQPVVRFMPGADSGTFDYFTEEINGELDASTSFGQQSEDDNVLVSGVAGDSNAIAYFGYAYFVENQESVRAIGVDGGSGCVEPTDETINSNEYAPLSRPLFIYPDVGKARERPELKAFVDFYLENAVALASEVGYVGLPDDLLQEAKDAWATAVGG